MFCLYRSLDRFVFAGTTVDQAGATDSHWMRHCAIHRSIQIRVFSTRTGVAKATITVAVMGIGAPVIHSLQTVSWVVLVITGIPLKRTPRGMTGCFKTLRIHSFVDTAIPLKIRLPIFSRVWMSLSSLSATELTGCAVERFAKTLPGSNPTIHRLCKTIL